MKHLYAVVAAAAMLFAIDASAQLSHGIRFGVVGGFTSTNTHLKEFDYRNVSLFHVGATVKFNLGAGFALQPALTYQVKGTELNAQDPETASLEGIWTNMDARVGYLELPLQIQWGPDLMALRPYAFVEPFFGYGVNFHAEAENSDGAVIDNLKNKWKEAALSHLEYGMGFGGGIEVNHFQISAQWFMNFGGLADENGKVDGHVIGETIMDHLKKKNFQGFKISLAVLF